MIERRPRAPVLRSSALRAMAFSAVGRISVRRPSISNSLLVLLDQRVLRLGQDLTSAPRRVPPAWRPPAGGRRIPGSGRT
jgi:hypothetical protein